MRSSSDSLRLTKTVTASKSLAELREFYKPDRHVVTHCRAWAYPIARSGGLAEHAFLELTVRDMGSHTGRCTTVRLDWTDTGLFGYVYLSSDAMCWDTGWHYASHIWNGVDQNLENYNKRSVFVGTVLDACEIRMRLPYSLVSNNCLQFTSFLLRAVRAYADHHLYRYSSSFFARTEGEDRYLTEQLIGHELRSKLKRGRETGREVFQIGNCTVLDCPAGHMARRMENLLLWCVEHRRRFVVVCSCNVDAPQCKVRQRLKSAQITNCYGTPVDVFHDAISIESLCSEIANRMTNTFTFLSYGTPHHRTFLESMLSALREESHSSRFDNIDWITKLFTVSARKSADLVVIQYEDSLTDDLRATIMECWEHKQQVVLLHVLPVCKVLDQSLRQTVRAEMIAAGFGDVPHFFGVMIIRKHLRPRSYHDPEEVETRSFDDVDGIVKYIFGISSGQATLHNIRLARWMCKLLTDDELC